MLKGLFFTTEDIKKDKKLKKTLWPLFIDGIQLPQGYNHFEEAVYFLPLKCLSKIKCLAYTALYLVLRH